MVFQSIFLTEYLHIGALTLLVNGTFQLYQYELHIVSVAMFLFEPSVRLHARYSGPIFDHIQFVF